MALSQVTSGTVTPSSSTYATVLTETTTGMQVFQLDLTNSAGAVYGVSVQKILESGGVYQEVANYTISVPVTISAAPSIGYQPLWQSDWFDNEFGLQVQIALLSGSAPGTAMPWVLNGIS